MRINTTTCLCLFLGVFFGLQAQAQNTLTCGDDFFDTGGATADYSVDENVTTVISPVNASDVVTVTFTAFDVEDNYDALYVYDGPDATFPLIDSGNPATNSGFPAGGYYGNTIPGPFQSTDASGSLTFVFRSDGIVTNPGWEASVTCGPPPSCDAPSDLTATAIMTDSADLGWTENDGATQWDIELLEAADPQTGTPTYTGVTANPYNATSLNPGTDYKFYVRSYCSDGTFSNWEGPFFFTTLCAPFSSFTENFDTTPEEEVPICWSRIVNSTDAFAEVGVDGFDSFSDPNNLRIYNGNDLASELLLITPPLIDLPLGTCQVSQGC